MSVKFPFTVSAIVVCAVKGPFVPVTVIVPDPIAAVAFAESVTTTPVVEDVGLNDAVTPDGNPLAANDTLPAKPPKSVMPTVDVPLVR